MPSPAPVSALADGGGAYRTPGHLPDAAKPPGHPSSEAGMLSCPFCGGPCAASVRACPHCDVELASVRCPSCFALHFAGSQFCAHCGKELELEPVLEATHAPCPRCDAALSVATGGATDGPESAAGTPVHECTRCGGIFLDNRALERIMARREQTHGVSEHPHTPPAAGPHALDTVRYLKCPFCRTIMNRSNFGKRSGVIVDVCKAHGTWFDAGELTRAIEFVAHGGLEETRRRDAEELHEQKSSAAVARAAAEMQVHLTREAVEEGRAVGWWVGRGSSGWGNHHGTLMDVLLHLLG